MKYWTLLIVFVLMLAGCGTAVATPEPILFPDLPTAVPPSVNTSAGSWAVSYSYQFPDNFWTTAEGTHRYAFNLVCPDELSDLEFDSPWRTFQVATEQAPQPDIIYLRLQGLSQEVFVPRYMPEAVIHPNQATAAVVHFLGLQEETAEQAIESCAGLIAWDEAPPQTLTPSEPFQP
ncbi:MAG: hypothetical protein GY796_00835 [Chloroflexi bacterium]|nr:hypothetical protein [Chloroflexota bacterium]